MFTQSKILASLGLILYLTGFPVGTARAADTPPDFAAIDTYIETQIKELRIPGLALGIVQGDRIVHLKGFGIADPSGRVATAQTPFQIASLGKPMTGVAIMQLVEQGKLELDAPVQRYLPWFRVADEAASAQITVRHLLYHTSGLPETVGMEYALRGDNRPDALEARVRELRSVQLNRPIGASYEYANAGYMILGLLIQQVSGQPHADYLREHLFAPLQMNQAFPALADAQAHGVATGYRYWFGLPRPDLLPVDRAMLPAGGTMSASAEDMTHFLIANLNAGRFGNASILSPTGIAEMQRPVVPVHSQIGAGDEFYAMDWGNSQIGGAAVLMKGGDNADFKTNMVLIPAQHLGVVVLINANNPLAAYFGDPRIPLLTYHIVELLLGQPLTIFPVSQTPMIIHGVLLLIIAIQLGGMGLTLLRLRRWQTGRSQPLSQRAWALHISLPLVLNLAWGVVALVVAPRLLGLPLSFIQYLSPDLGYTLLVSGAVALGWGVVRTVLAYLALRPTSAPITSRGRVAAHQ
jgi:CubicO group peptidase (beta-lactamase class C family)